MEQHNTAVFNLARYPFANAVGGGVRFPVKRVNIRNKSKDKIFYKQPRLVSFFTLIKRIVNSNTLWYN